MNGYRYRELSEDDLRRLEPGAEIWVKHDRAASWRGPRQFDRLSYSGPLAVDTSNNRWDHAAIREPVEPEQVITMDREWQTRDGQKFHVYCTDAPGPYPVHGRVEGHPLPTFRKRNGRVHEFGDSGDLIPAPDWREQIPWDVLADWVQWVARDGDDRWFAYKCKPQARVDEFRAHGSMIPLEAIRMPDGPTDWREAIAQRPGGGAA